MNTAEAIVEASLKLLTAHLPIPSTPSAGSLPITAGLSAFDFIVNAELSKFSYVFSLDSVALNTPYILDESKYPAPPEGSSYTYYQIPPNTGEIFTVIKAEYVPEALSLLSRSRKSITNSIAFTPISSDILQVPVDDDDLYMIYVNLAVSPSKMSGPFKNGLRYAVASELVTLYKDARSIRQSQYWMQKADVEFKEAQRLNSLLSGDRESPPTIDDILHRGGTDGRIGYLPYSR